MQPLDDIRVLDLGHVYNGPYCGMILAFLGADVIKIEPPEGESLRSRSETLEPIEVQFINLNKRGLSVDLKHEKGKDVFKELVNESDIVLENFSHGTMESLDLGYEHLKEINNDLIYAHGSGFGDTGPYRDYPAMDLAIQAMSGVAYSTGYMDGGPLVAGNAVSDFLGGIHLTVGILSALYQRARTGTGQYVDVSMYDSTFPSIISSFAKWMHDPSTPPRTGNHHSGLNAAPYNIYEVEDGHVAIAATTERLWEKFVQLLDRPEWINDERFDTLVERASHYEDIDNAVEEWLEGKSLDESLTQLRDAGIICAPVQTFDELTNDPQLENRNMINKVPNKGEGEMDPITVPGNPIKLSSSDPVKIKESPRVGEHNHEILKEVLDYSDERIDNLSKKGVINEMNLSK